MRSVTSHICQLKPLPVAVPVRYAVPRHAWEVSKLPFVQGDGPADGPVGSALPPARFVVDPDQLRTLKRGLEEEIDNLERWWSGNKRRLRVDPPGADPCSEPTAIAFGGNGDEALLALSGYITQLKQLANALGEAAGNYHRLDEDGVGRLRQ